MSELKDRWFWAYPTESVDCDGITGSAHEVYSKSEADEVIAEKDKEISELQAMLEERNRQIGNLDAIAKRNHRAAQTLRKKMNHHKYKLCLAMARWCNYWANYWEGCEPSDCGMFISKAKFYRRWHRRWLELAKKFKEAK